MKDYRDELEKTYSKFEKRLYDVFFIKNFPYYIHFARNSYRLNHLRGWPAL